MARRKKDVSWPHLNNAEGKMDANWYVEYSLRNPFSGEVERFRIYEGFNQFDTYRERMLYAEKLIAETTLKIKSGEIALQQFVEYEDLLNYSGNYFNKKKKAHAGSLVVLISDFLSYKKLEVEVKTFETYVSKMRVFSSYLEKEGMLDKPATYYKNQIITDFLKSIAFEKKLSTLSVEKYQQILHTLFKYIIEVKEIEMRNPVLNIPRIGIIKDESPAAIPKEIRMLLQETIEPMDPQLWMAICFQYYTAIRPGKELRLMKLNQINYSAKTITVKNYLAKNGRTEVVDIPDQLWEMIVNGWKLPGYNQNFFLLGKEGIPGEEHLGKNSLRCRFNTFRNELNLSKEVKFYSWKHSGAQELSISGTNIYELQKHLRHKSISTTEQYLKKRIGQRSNFIKHNFPSI